MCFREYRFYEHNMRHAISMSVSYAEEQSVLSRFDVALAIQKQEYLLLQKMLPNKLLLLCPHSINVSYNYQKLNSIENNSIKNIGFIGADNEANRSGLKWFLEQVWPVVKQLNLIFYIFGSVGEQFQEICNSDEAIKNMSSDLSQEEIYNMVDCMINPVFVGGGLKIKTLEALAYGKPIVSTKEGSVGIGEEGENGIVVARSRLEFIEGLMQMVYEPNFVGNLIQQGYKTIKEQFSTESCYKSLIDLLNY
jgi:glycosyltransferase involved in cell wall biosynthesis